MKDMVDEIMRNRINALKRFMEFSQKILYQIKNKFKIQLVEKGLTDFEKIKQKYFIKEKIDKSKLELSGDAEIVLNFQSKFKYINTTKENNYIKDLYDTLVTSIFLKKTEMSLLFNGNAR